MTDQLEQGLREAFSRRAAQLDQDSITRLSAIDYKPRRRRLGKLPAIGGLAGVGIAGAVAVIVSLSAGTAPAFAGWQSTPTKPAAGQLAQAAQACGQGLGSPVLTDSRGPYTAAIYANSTTDDLCLTGNGVSMQSRSSSSTPMSVAAGQIQFGGGGTRDSAGNDLTLADGRIGTGVTTVTLELSDSSSVQTTVDNGWYMAWWPGKATATNAEITTASGTSTVKYPAAPTLPACPTGSHCSSGYSFGSSGGQAHSSGATMNSASAG